MVLKKIINPEKQLLLIKYQLAVYSYWLLIAIMIVTGYCMIFILPRKVWGTFLKASGEASTREDKIGFMLRLSLHIMQSTADPCTLTDPVSIVWL